MPTDEAFSRIYNKKIMPTEHFKDKFLDFLSEQTRRGAAYFAQLDDMLVEPVVLSPSLSANAISVTSEIRGMTGGDGGDNNRLVNISGVDARFQNFRVPPGVGVVFHVGVEQNDVEDGVEINPRTGEPEYSQFKELPGRVEVPNAVVDNGTTLTFTVDDALAAGGSEDHTGRTIRVWLKSRSNGGIGPVSPTPTVAIQELTVFFSGGDNKVTSADLFGQESPPSTNPSDYLVQAVGPTVSDTTLYNEPNVLYLGQVTSVAAAAIIPGGNISTANQNVFTGVSDYTDIDGPGMITGLDGSTTGGLNFAITDGVVWINKKRRVIPPQGFAAVDNATSYLYVNDAGGVNVTTTEFTAWGGGFLQALPLFKFVASGGSITSFTDIRRYMTRRRQPGTIVVHDNEGAIEPSGDFVTLPGAVAWVKGQVAAGNDSSEIHIVRYEANGGVPVVVDIPITFRGNAGAATPIPITLSTSQTLFKLKNGASGSKFIGFYAEWGGTPTTASHFIEVDAAESVHDVEIAGCHINGPTDTGVVVVDATLECSRWKVHNNVFNSTATDLDAWFRGPFSKSDFHDNTFLIGLSGKAIQIESGGLDTTVHDNTINGANDAGVVIDTGCDRCSVHNNRFTNAFGTVIRSSSPQTSISGNTISSVFDTSATGGVIEVLSAKLCTVQGNTIHTWETGWAIRVFESDKTVVTGNNLLTGDDKPITGGILVDNSASVVVANNLIDGNEGAAVGVDDSIGINAPTSTYLTISGNQVFNFGTTAQPGGGILTDGGHTTITDNMLQFIKGHGIKIDSLHNHVIGNRAINIDEGNAVFGDGSTDRSIVTANELASDDPTNFPAIFIDSPANANNKVFSNITNSEVGGGGVFESVIMYHRTHDPVSQNFPASTTVVLTGATSLIRPDTGHAAIVPHRWTLPPKLSNVEGGIRFTYADGTQVERFNTTGVTLSESHDDFHPGVDGVAIKRIDLIGKETSGSPQTVELAADFAVSGLFV